MLEGVKIIPLMLLPNERGRLMEIQRVDDPHYLGFGQVYLTSTKSKVIKAWYRHTQQIDQIITVDGLFKLVLFDSRPDSPTQNQIQEIIFGETAPKLIQFPPGIWHGFQNIGDKEAFLVHLNNQPFNFQNPDEERLPIETKVIPYTW